MNQADEMSSVVEALLKITEKLSSIDAHLRGNINEMKRIERKGMENEDRIRILENSLSRRSGAWMVIEQLGWKVLPLMVSLIISAAGLMIWLAEQMVQFYR